MIKKIILILTVFTQIVQAQAFNFSNPESNEHQRALVIELLLHIMEVDRTVALSVANTPATHAVFKKTSNPRLQHAALSPAGLQEVYKSGVQHKEWGFNHLYLAIVKMLNEGLDKSNVVGYTFEKSNRLPGDYVDVTIESRGAAESSSYGQHPAFHDFVKCARRLPEQMILPPESPTPSMIGELNTHCQPYGCWMKSSITLSGLTFAFIANSFQKNIAEEMDEATAIEKTIESYEEYHSLFTDPQFITIYNEELKKNPIRMQAFDKAFVVFMSKIKTENSPTDSAAEIHKKSGSI